MGMGDWLLAIMLFGGFIYVIGVGGGDCIVLVGLERAQQLHLVVCWIRSLSAFLI